MEYGDKIANVSYSKITESVLPSYIEGELGTVIIDKISEPSSVTLKMRGEISKNVYSSSCENNMVFEVSSFRDMILGRMDHRSFFEVSEILMKALDNVVLAQKNK